MCLRVLELSTLLLYLPGDDFQGFGGMDEKEGRGSGGNQSSMGGPDVPSNGGSASQQAGMGMPDFLPPAQRMLFLRIQQKQQEDEERARLAKGGGERDVDGTLFTHTVDQGQHTFSVSSNHFFIYFFYT